MQPKSANEVLASVEFADMNLIVELFFERHKRVPTMTELAKGLGKPIPIHKFIIDGSSKKVKLVPAN
ncbi:MAG: hypothetical protein FJ386_14410 [Verrucomicrobia bacterium]|nr:hypothetical protein [Verrucomicrobiota bacterium]